MATGSQILSQDVSSPSRLNQGYAPVPDSRPNSIVASDFLVRGGRLRDASPGSNAAAASPSAHPAVGQQSRFQEALSPQRASSVIENSTTGGEYSRAGSRASMSHPSLSLRSATLKKKSSLSKKASLRRGGSRKSSRAGSVRSMNLGEKEKYGVAQNELNSAFYIPIPTSGNPTEILANRFSAWRKVLKDLVTFFRDIQRSYETRSKMLLSASNTMNNITIPPTFLISGGISDATSILKDYHKQSLHEANKAKDVQTEIIMQLNGLRNDLQQKIKEIKNLSGDFKNSVEKEVENTRKVVRHFHEALGLVDSDPAATSGKGDPFLIRMGVERQIEKQLEEENYLHRAYLNLESSGRELESIVVGEIQKAYNAYASILKRDADTSYDAVERLRDGPISMPKDLEWNAFVEQSDQLIAPKQGLRDVSTIVYPGNDHPTAAEVRSGMLERKSKYLKSYTPGWYVLSPTHLHEFKSVDRIASQNPVMSLYLPEQKLGSHSQPESSSHKFMLKGRQTGAMHRGHAWVFRAESHETMLAWYEDIKALTEKTGEARNAFIRRHARSQSGISYRGSSISSDGVLDEDEADETPYSGEHTIHNQTPYSDEQQWQRGQPGGRFPSDINMTQATSARHSHFSEISADGREAIAANNALPGSTTLYNESGNKQHTEGGEGESRSVPQLYETRQNGNYSEWVPETWERTVSPAMKQNVQQQAAARPNIYASSKDAENADPASVLPNGVPVESEEIHPTLDRTSSSSTRRRSNATELNVPGQYPTPQRS